MSYPLDQGRQGGVSLWVLICWIINDNCWTFSDLLWNQILHYFLIWDLSQSIWWKHQYIQCSWGITQRSVEGNLDSLYTFSSGNEHSFHCFKYTQLISFGYQIWKADVTNKIGPTIYKMLSQRNYTKFQPLCQFKSQIFC